jgi:putative membrane protein
MGIKNWLRKTMPITGQIWAFLQKTLSDRKNLVRFVFATVAIIVTAQSMPGISIASFMVAALLILVMMVLMVVARPALALLKIPNNIFSYGVFLLLSNWIILVFLDWTLWYFETTNIWWVLLFSTTQAVFNCIIENLIQEE